MVVNCKDSPVLSTENPFDPESENYIISPPSNLNISIDTEVQLSWNPSTSGAFDGYLVYYSFSDTSNFEIVAELDKETSSYIHLPNGNPINLLYRVVAFYDQVDKRIFSDPVNSEVTQQIFNVCAFLNENLTVRLNIEHNFKVFSEFKIEQRIGSSSPFEFLTTLSTDSNSTTIEYSTLPDEEITYRVFVENEFERTEYFSVVPTTYLTPPYELKILPQINDTEIEIGWENYSEEVDEFVLYLVDHEEDSFISGEPLIKVPGNSNSLTISNLDPEKEYSFSLKVRKGGFHSRSGSYFTIYNVYGPKLNQSAQLEMDGLPIVKGGISSDGLYTAFTLNEEIQYLYDANSLQQLFKIAPYPRAVYTKILELNGDSYYYEFTNSGTVNLKRALNNSIYKSIPPIDSNGGIQAIDFIGNTTMIIVFSNKLTQTSISNKIGIYDLEQEKYIDTLVSNSSQNHYQIAHSKNSIIAYEIFSQKIYRYSIRDFSYLDEIDTKQFSSGDLQIIEAENVPDSIAQDSDFYILQENSSAEFFRLDLNSLYKENITLSDGSAPLYQFSSSQKGQLRCGLYNDNFNKTGMIECYRFNETPAFTFQLNTRIAGFLLSQNDEFMLIFTDNEIQKYFLNKEWVISISTEL